MDSDCAGELNPLAKKGSFRAGRQRTRPVLADLMEWSYPPQSMLQGKDSFPARLLCPGSTDSSDTKDSFAPDLFSH